MATVTVWSVVIQKILKLLSTSALPNCGLVLMSTMLVGGSLCLPHPVKAYWHRANQSRHWPYNERRLAEVSARVPTVQVTGMNPSRNRPTYSGNRTQARHSRDGQLNYSANGTVRELGLVHGPSCTWECGVTCAARGVWLAHHDKGPSGLTHRGKSGEMWPPPPPSPAPMQVGIIMMIIITITTIILL